MHMREHTYGLYREAFQWGGRQKCVPGKNVPVESFLCVKIKWCNQSHSIPMV